MPEDYHKLTNADLESGPDVNEHTNIVIDDDEPEAPKSRAIDMDSYEMRDRKYKSPRYWAIMVCACVVTVVGSFFVLMLLGRGRPARTPGLSFNEYWRGAYRASGAQIQWVPDGSNGEYITVSGTDYVIASVGDSKLEVKICSAKPKLGNQQRSISSVTVNNGFTKAIVSTERDKHWRHSSTANYWLVDIESGDAIQIGDARLRIALFSPDGSKVAYVKDHDLYTLDAHDHTTKQVTSDGSADIFNGIPDWVYEEEVFSGDTAAWWSLDGKYLMWLKANDSSVPTYPVEYYIKEDAGQYPTVKDIKYPKAGAVNPEVDLYIYNYDDESTKKVDIKVDDKIVTEVVWADTHAIVKVSTRDSDVLTVFLVDPDSAEPETVRTLNANDDGGWFEISHNTIFVPAGDGRDDSGYIDTVIVEGYNHLGYFSPLNSSDPEILTRGKWEVADSAHAFNPSLNKVFFSGTKEAVTRQNIYAVDLLGSHNIEDVTKNGTYSVSFSGQGSHALISYNGPDIPRTDLVDLSSYETLKTVENNDALRELLSNRTLPQYTFGQVEVAPGVSVNYREIRPSGFDKSKKHPVLFYNYGGPGSQMVQESYGLDFQAIFAETRNAVVVTVDPRGTGNMGRAFRAIVRDRLGYYEAHDVIEAAKVWNEKDYVDPEYTAIWGWSYGGFLTLKVLETDAGNAFKYGAAVAPVTDWRFYDSIYTERYMHEPSKNPKGYDESAISNATALAQNKRFLIMHGTGDDNVHFQNTLVLLDKLDLQGVENYDVHVFPDSDHSIAYHNANPIVYDKLNTWLHQHQLKQPKDKA